MLRLTGSDESDSMQLFGCGRTEGSFVKRRTIRLGALSAPAALLAGVGAGAWASPPRYDHVVVVVIENVNYSQVIGSAGAPYINSLRAGGANLEHVYAFLHTSAPNYGELYAGNDSAINDGSI